ncbi:hypothetical protein ACJMK2_012941, partial [Sinanodonta woodiana]
MVPGVLGIIAIKHVVEVSREDGEVYVALFLTATGLTVQQLIIKQKNICFNIGRVQRHAIMAVPLLSDLDVLVRRDTKE